MPPWSEPLSAPVTAPTTLSPLPAPAPPPPAAPLPAPAPPPPRRAAPPRAPRRSGGGLRRVRLGDRGRGLAVRPKLLELALSLWRDYRPAAVALAAAIAAPAATGTAARRIDR